MEKNLKMRSLKSKDLFKMSKILKKINVDMKQLNVEGLSQEQAGMALVKTALENVWLAEEEVNEFLAALVNISAEEFSELDLEETFEIIKQFKDQKGLLGFFNSLAS